MSSSNPHLPNPDTHDSLPFHPDSPQDIYLSLADIADLSQQPPASPRHQRIHTYDHPSDTPVRLTSARFAGTATRSGSVDSPLRPGFQPQPFEGTSQSLDPQFAIRDLDEYPRGHPAFSRSPSRKDEQEEEASHESLTPSESRRVSTVTPLEEERRPSHRNSEQHNSNNQLYSNRDSYSDYDYTDIIPEGEEEAELITEEEYRPPIPQVKDMSPTKPTDLRVDVNTNVPSPFFPKRSTSIKKLARKLIPPKSPEINTKQQNPSNSSFWSWNKTPQTMESPSTQFSESATPLSAEHHKGVEPEPMPTSTEYTGDEHYFGSEVDYSSPRSASPLPYGAQGAATNVAELLQELQEVSAELANSIRREMELEDEVDQIKTEVPGGPAELSRRTSDYYSDSGASSAKLPAADTELKLVGLERMRRKAEQEKAQLRVDMAQRVQEDLNQRRALEMHIQSLEEQLQHASSSRDLEGQLESAKRQLADEKEFKANFEDLLAGMRQEIESMRTERDNLRDDVVPKLTQDSQTLSYENSRLQQEIQNLKNENSTLQNARKLQFRTITEEGSEPLQSPTGLSRSNSLARSKSTRGRSGSLIGPGKEQIPPEAVTERLKDIEEQRDALHRTLKALLLRQDQLSRTYQKKYRLLETERDKALSGIPRRAAFHVEVQSLRTEINQLRQRADEALEQKFSCEKGLSGLKMDLDRAQQETSSLRDLLQEHDIDVPDSLSTFSAASSDSGDSLEKAYADLKRTHADSIAAGQEIPAEARMHALSVQVSAQQSSNRELHARLAEAIERGEQEQAASAKKINDLQSALRSAEERVMAAQSISEDAVGIQEDYAHDVKNALTDQSKRGVSTPKKATLPDARTGLHRLFSTRTPKLDATSSGKGMSVADASRTVALEKRVKELEEAAGRAEEEMHEVVERMNNAQIEVADLQTQRDEAMRTTKALQREILGERTQAEAILKGRR